MGSYRTYRISGYGTEVLQNSQNFRVLWHGRTELTQVMKMIYPYPVYLWHWRTELPEVPGTGMNVPRLRVFCRVRTNRALGIYPGYYPTKNFCKFCRAFAPVPRIPGGSVRHSYLCPELLEVLYARVHNTRGTGTACFVPARNVCEFCTPVPQYPELLEVL